jgi:hypothetical protein
VCVVLFETGSNQRYVFGSNKIKEITGASFLLEEVVSGLLGRTVTDLRSSEPVLPLAKLTIEEHGFELIHRGSGKALAVVDPDRMGPDDLIFGVTSNALAEAPGVDVVGVSSPRISWETGNVAGMVAPLFDQLANVRETRAIATRFGRLPITAACASTGLGAGALGERNEVVSHVAAAKRANHDRANKRISKLIGDLRDSGPKNSGDLAEAFEADWLAVIHIDGNGFGVKLVDLCAKWSNQATDNRGFIDAYRTYCEFLDETAERALGHAANSVKTRQQKVKRGTKNVYAVLPLVFGGDDLTVVTTAADSLLFAVAYQREFERLTTASEHGLLTAAAGVAVIKPKYPLYAAYNLADSLTTNAKTVKGQIPACSSLDVHVLHDSIADTIEPIRKRLEVEQAGREPDQLWGGPYVVSADETASNWPALRHIRVLRERCDAMHHTTDGRRTGPEHEVFADSFGDAMHHTTDGRRTLPRGVVKRLRDELFIRNGPHRQTLNELLDVPQPDHAPIRPFLEQQDPPSLISEHGTTAFLDAVALFDAGVDMSFENVPTRMEVS